MHAHMCLRSSGNLRGYVLTCMHATNFRSRFTECLHDVMGFKTSNYSRTAPALTANTVLIQNGKSDRLILTMQADSSKITSTTFQRKVLLLGKRSSNLERVYSVIFETDPKSWSNYEFSKLGEIYLAEEWPAKEILSVQKLVCSYVQPNDDFNAVLFVIDKEDFVTDSFLQLTRKFRQEKMCEIYGVVITKCSEKDNVADLLKENPNELTRNPKFCKAWSTIIVREGLR